MAHDLTLDALWDSVTPGTELFQPALVAGRPETARRYLEHAIAPGTPLASAVRLRMHGQIKLKGWLPFKAEQVIVWNRAMIWRATVRMRGLPVSGWDRLVNGEGAQRWRLLGLFPVMTASGPDVTRSAIGRVRAESIWLPSALTRSDVSWVPVDARHARGVFTLFGRAADLGLAIDASGRVVSVKLKRWGSPDGGHFHYSDFGGVADEERTFGGYTIPTRLRVGWYVWFRSLRHRRRVLPRDGGRSGVPVTHLISSSSPVTRRNIAG